MFQALIVVLKEERVSAVSGCEKNGEAMEAVNLWESGGVNEGYPGWQVASSR